MRQNFSVHFRYQKFLLFLSSCCHLSSTSNRSISSSSVVLPLWILADCRGRKRNVKRHKKFLSFRNLSHKGLRFIQLADFTHFWGNIEVEWEREKSFFYYYVIRNFHPPSLLLFILPLRYDFHSYPLFIMECTSPTLTMNNFLKRFIRWNFLLFNLIWKSFCHCCWHSRASLLNEITFTADGTIALAGISGMHINKTPIPLQQI